MKTITIVIIIAAILTLLGVLYLTGIIFKNDSMNFDDCACLEKEKPYCQEGFTLLDDGITCLKGEKYTNVIKGCSKYNCSGEIIGVQ